MLDSLAIAIAVSFLRESTSEAEENIFLGADVEWETGVSGRKKVMTIQIGPLHGTPFPFHLQRGTYGFTKDTFPAPIKDPLAKPNIIELNQPRGSPQNSFVRCLSIPIFQ